MRHILTLLLSLILTLNFAQGQVPKDSELFLLLKKQDSTFFERGFNQCDLAYLEGAIHPELRFYHDQSGIQDKKIFFENTQKYICSDLDKKPIRKVEEQSLEVFPLYNNGVLYGAIQSGVHHFYIREPQKTDVQTSTAKFTHLYLLENGKWLLKEVLSFDHNNPNTSPTTLSFDKEIVALLEQHKVPALGLGIIQNGNLSKINVYGSLKAGTAAPYNTIFKVASLAKPIAAMVTLKLVDSGQLSLDEQLDKYWVDPDLKKDKRTRKLTPRIILTHQTGFPNWRWMSEKKKLAFEFEPGTKYQYSGEGFEYLRKALEKKFGKSLEELSDSLVFRPAKMNDTRYWWNNSMDEKRYAENHDKDGKQLDTYKYYEANAAANLLTTVEDYGNFLAYVLHGAGLSEQTYQEMTKSQIKLRDKNYFGLGWEKLTDFSTGEYALLHTGRDHGLSSLAIMFPESGNGYVIFLNGENVDQIYEKLLIEHLYLGKELWDRR
ncbi:beta-lactamase [Pontibacter korlensis]|uniref:Beta-lactamase n=1 Tax=Pontibacter korlensis TaxID=400092 RepID=A0A0E3ZHK0_9BACT|nr:serine hydrolase [Pontibacter korlensis]AKD05518.1 beta-lactamase [Pontibacter korlensis]